MWEVVTKIRDDKQDFPIQVVVALDDTCMTCPHHGETACQAGPDSNEHVISMDQKVIRHLGIEENGV